MCRKIRLPLGKGGKLDKQVDSICESLRILQETLERARKLEAELAKSEDS